MAQKWPLWLNQKKKRKKKRGGFAIPLPTNFWTIFDGLILNTFSVDTNMTYLWKLVTFCLVTGYITGFNMKINIKK